MSDLVERINEIDAILAYDGSDNASDDNGYQAFVKMRKIWPQLRVLPEQLVSMRSALAPFAKLADDMERINVPPVGDDYKLGHSSITMRNLRAARTAFTDDQSEKSK